MAKIQVLSEETIDKIAAGEVIERPASIVKELIENAIDSGANAITVEIKEGGISFIRVTDNGEGIERDQVRNAFYRHATSKITDAEEIDRILTLGFRGEALSSIAAVAQVEMITKTKEELVGVRYAIEGAREMDFSEIGIPNGTTVIVRNVFFNTPVRRKFLRTPTTEAGYITDICEHLAMSKPNISFKFINSGQVKFHTSGDGDLKELIYRIYGKDVTKEMIPFEQESKDITIEGFLGKPTINRSNRNYENYYINGRYIKSSMIAKAVENGYKPYLMQHKFPFFVLNIRVNTKMIDVNVHPTKMDVRFSNQEYFYDYLASAISSGLRVHEMIPDIHLEENSRNQDVVPVNRDKTSYPEPFEEIRKGKFEVNESSQNEYKLNQMQEQREKLQDLLQNINPNKIIGNDSDPVIDKNANFHANIIKAENSIFVDQNIQMTIFDDKVLTKENFNEYNILGQIFDTYWLISFRDKLLILDQHAAHEKIKYESMIQRMKENKVQKQIVNPPIVISLSGQEESLLKTYKEIFEKMGFEIEEFGGNEIAVRSVPIDLYGKNEKEMFVDVLDELSNDIPRGTPEYINEKIASMACKAAVKGNHSMTVYEVKSLIEQLFTLDNPYNCPHGRPTIISMSKYEIEKKFKRIV